MQTKNSNYESITQVAEEQNKPPLPPRGPGGLGGRGTPVGGLTMVHRQRHTPTPLGGYGPYTPVPVPKPVASVATPPPYRMPPYPLPPLPGATLSETPPPLHTHSNKFPIEREVILSSTDKNSKIPILSEYNKRPKSSVAPEGPQRQVAWTDNSQQDLHSPSKYLPVGRHDVERGVRDREEKTKITKTYHTIKDMISSRFNKNKEMSGEEMMQMNNAGQHDGVDGLESRMSNMVLTRGGGRPMPPLPVVRPGTHPNFPTASDMLSPILPSSPISPQQQQRRLAQAGYEDPYGRTAYATARAHLVQTVPEGYAPGPPQQRRVAPPYRYPTQELSQSSPNLTEESVTAKLESNGVYITKTPNASSQNPLYGTRPLERKMDSETDDDGGFKKPAGVAGLNRREGGEGADMVEGDKKMATAMEPGRTPDNKVSSATSSDYEKATRRSVGLSDSGRGSAAYSSGRLESDAASGEPVGVPHQNGGPPKQSDPTEWVDIVESELRQILDPKMHGLSGLNGLSGCGSGRGSTLSESASSLTPPLPPLSPGGGSSPSPKPRHMRYKHSSLPYGMKTDSMLDERKYGVKMQRNGAPGAGRSWSGSRTSKNTDKSRIANGSTSRNCKIPLALFGTETDLASTTTGPLDSVLDSRLSDRSSDEDLSTTIDATDALAIRKQLQGLENMYSEVLKLLGVKKHGVRYQPSEPRTKRRYGSMSSLPSSVSSRPIRDKRREDRKKVKDMKGINKRFQRLESHVVTLARSVAHLSSEMRTQHLMIQEMDNIRGEISSLRAQTSLHARSQSMPRALNSMLMSPGATTQGTAPGDRDPSALTNPARVKKLTKFFGDEPPLLRLFLKRLGYEKYANMFENEKIGMVELPYLTEERLQKMGVPMGPRLRILQEAQISFCRDSVYIV